MQNRYQKILLAALAVCLAKPAFAQSNVTFLTYDPEKNKPTVVAETNQSNAVVFRSINYADPANPPAFTMVFENFVGLYDTSFPNTSTGTDNSPGAGQVTFTSSSTVSPGGSCTYIPPGSGGAVHQCQEVRIKLLNNTGAGPGLLYTVEMNNVILDPRLRGN